MADKHSASNADPERFKIGESSAARLAAMTDLRVDGLIGRTLADVVNENRFVIDPQLLFFRRICGTVVKTDPVTGIDYPVPFATVQVEDTDCSFLGYFPGGSPWSWFFPFHCRREVIGTTQTDECGRFCVWVPRWDIDWILRFRRERRCYPVIFERPTLRDILDIVIPREIPKFRPRPGPYPDPAPFADLDLGRLNAGITDAFGGEIAARLARLRPPAVLGARTADIDEALDAPAMLHQFRPPLSAELRGQKAAFQRNDQDTKPSGGASGQRGGEGPRRTTATHPAIGTLAARLAIEPESLRGVDLRRWVGPFFRCRDVFVAEWTPLLDIPDITFRVLQDTNSDGVEEQIYGEGHFQVRWNAGAIPNVMLHAGPQARSAPRCGPTDVPCGDVPAIVLADRLPVTGDPSVFDNVTGYAVRTNRPHPSGLFDDPLPNPPSETPLAGLLSLYGCVNTDRSATHYRLVYRRSTDNGATFDPPAADPPAPMITGPWNLFRLNGLGIGEYHSPVADAAGWYPIALPPGPSPWQPQNLLIDWPTASFGDGVYEITLQLGSGGTVSSSAAPIRIVVDNARPAAPIQVETSDTAAGPWTPIDGICPVVRRGVTPHDVHFRVTLAASAAHLRTAQLFAHGCGGGSFTFESGTGGHQAVPGSTTYQHWHETANDDAQTLQVIYRLPAGVPEGTYSFSALVYSRAFDPDYGGHMLTPPFQDDPAQIYTNPSVAFSVFNSN